MVRRVVLTAFALFSLLLAAPGVSAEAVSETTIIKFPVAGFGFVNTCTDPDETVTLTSGNFQIVMHTTADANGGLHFAFEGNASNVAGVGDTGTKYRASGGFWGAFNATAGGTTESTFVDVINLTSQGSGDNFQLMITSHFTVTPDGTVTAVVDNFRVVCRG